MITKVFILPDVYKRQDTVDIPELQEGSVIFLQWGYVYPDGQFISGLIKTIKIRDFDCIFDSTGTHVTIKCIDSVGDLRFQPPYRCV